MNILFSWLGDEDRNACKRKRPDGGPLVSMLATGKYSAAIIITNWDEEIRDEKDRTRKNTEECIEWLQTLSNAKLSVRYIECENPIDVEVIFPACLAAVKEVTTESEFVSGLNFNISSGTWALALVWSLISKTTDFNATLWSSSKETGPAKVNIPFELSAEFIPESLKTSILSERGSIFDEVLLTDNPYYRDISFRSEAMKQLKYDAIISSSHSLPVFINGPLGTEKAVLAKFIHENDPSKKGRFVKVTCGTDRSFELERKIFGERDPNISKNLHSDLDEITFIEQARGGTLYLEEIDKLSTFSQSLLLQHIEEAEFQKLEDPKKLASHARIIASSKSDLITAVQTGKFSEQLFFKLSTSIIRIPGISERGEDLVKIAESMLSKINSMRSFDEDYRERRFSKAAINFILNRKWPGNLMELDATIKRAALQSSTSTIMEEDIFNASLPLPEQDRNIDQVLNKDLGDGFDLDAEMRKVARHYLLRAMEQSGNNRAKASKLVGISNYQTFTNWLERYTKTPKEDNKV